ncbi:hypothetical protein [Chitinophaga sp. 212800010-3]|uniref:hypothetical protein n=1 Tax=unclassified Chitinophaga TaxID=2619133 RepID=UPI002DF0AD34|nr:hypothetical protein [Chitinophaga sp. 212800010-3]
MDQEEYKENYTHRQRLKLVEVSGIIIYPDDSGIPQDVIIIPYKAQNGDQLRGVIVSALRSLLEKSEKGIFTYFQNIRWIDTNLEDSLKKWQFLKGSFIGVHYWEYPTVRIGYGIIAFDQTFIDMEPIEPEECRVLNIEIDKTKYEFEVIEFPRELGIPKLFKGINLEYTNVE